MTNAEKYLKDGVDIENFTNSLCGFVENWELRNGIKNFLKKEAKPTLTEDERVILRNIDKKYKYISRGKGDIELYLRKEADDTCSYIFRGYKHLFQFIKERRRI